MFLEEMLDIIYICKFCNMDYKKYLIIIGEFGISFLNFDLFK